MLGPIDLEGRECDAMDRCATGFTCDVATRLCVRALDGGALDGGALDGGALDAGARDGGALDGGDAGTDSGTVDAATPTCTPACHPLAEVCTADGCELRVYATGDRRPEGREPRVFVLPPSIVDRGSVEVDFDALGPSFAGVDVDALDVILVPPNPDPSGAPYVACNFFNLPVRTADHPLIIANTPRTGAGEPRNVVCAHGNFWGGSHWILTGRDDPESRTGDPAFPGHAAGYASTRGTYGFEFLSSVIVQVASDVVEPTFEIDMIEISGTLAPGTASAPANPLLAVLGDPAGVVPRVMLHDLYVHDGGTAGLLSITLGGGTLEGLAVHRSRFLRSGGACLGVERLGAGSLLRENVLGACGLGARELPVGWRDEAVVVSALEGEVRVERNLVIGTRGRAAVFVDQGESDRGPITFRTSDHAVASVGGEAVALRVPVFGIEPLPDSTLTMTRWSFTGFDPVRGTFEPAWEPSNALLDIVTRGLRAELESVRWDAPHIIRAGPSGFDGVDAGMGVGPAAVDPVMLRDFLPAGVDVLRLEQWSETARRPATGDRTFAVGDVVVYRSALYRAARATTRADVPGTSDAWTRLPDPVDDVRFVAGSPYEGIGVGP